MRFIDKTRSLLKPTVDKMAPLSIFGSQHYVRHNQRRLEHLASLRLDLQGRTVLEVGAGIGDHTSFFLDRGCRVTSTDARSENLSVLMKRYPDVEAYKYDFENPDDLVDGKRQIVYCYGLLYHLSNPAQAIRFLAEHCSELLLMETCVTMGNANEVNLCAEQTADPSQSFTGKGCRPTRQWIYDTLLQHFEHVYLPISQPYHEQFPIDWTVSVDREAQCRSVFVASRRAIENPILFEGVPDKQVRL